MSRPFRRLKDKRKIVIILVNVIIIASILSFVVIYSRYESRESYERQIEHFENTTVTLERVTENYLEGEQRVCDVWAHYINNKNMTMEEATEYIRVSHALPKASAHLIFIDTLTGLSTRPKQGERYGPRSDRGTEAERLLSSLPIPQRISPFCAIPFMR